MYALQVTGGVHVFVVTSHTSEQPGNVLQQRTHFLGRHVFLQDASEDVSPPSRYLGSTDAVQLRYTVESFGAVRNPASRVQIAQLLDGERDLLLLTRLQRFAERNDQGSTRAERAQ